VVSLAEVGTFRLYRGTPVGPLIYGAEQTGVPTRQMSECDARDTVSDVTPVMTLR
jgi:hypothetical protein